MSGIRGNNEVSAEPERACPRTARVGKCPLCDSEGSASFFHEKDRLHATPGVFSYRRCFSCRTVYQDPRVVPDDLPNCYPSDYYTHDASTIPEPVVPLPSTGGGVKAQVQRAVVATVTGRPCRWDVAGIIGRVLARMRSGRERVYYLIDPLIPRPGDGPRALEVGCGTGNLLALLQRAGWDTDGVEWDSAAAAVARRNTGRNIFEGDFRRLALPPSGYGLVVLQHVFEHLDDPRGALLYIKTLLAPGGRAVLIYPNPESLVARVYGKNWFNWDPPRHLVIPSISALHKVAKDVGFARVWSTTSARNAASDFGRSRALARGKTQGELIHSGPGFRDRLSAVMERAAIKLGCVVGEEAIVVLCK